MRYYGIYFLMAALFLRTLTQTYSSFEIYKGDTINIVDNNGLKQGKWIVFGKNVNNPEYAPEQIVEEGYYKDGKKEGLWIKYYPSGVKRSEITYVGGRPKGPYRLYYENGKVEEEGNWDKNKNVGSFKRYYSNGNLQQEFNFNENGKREGIQRYYHENGQLAIEGNWQDGKENGEVKEYYPDGTLKSIKVFNNGVFDETKSKEFPPSQPKQPSVVIADNNQKKVEAPPPAPEEKPNLGEFTGDGFFILYNKNKMISQKGVFKNGKLWDGKFYKYNANGILIKVEVYKEGRYIGDAPLEEELKQLNMTAPKK